MGLVLTLLLGCGGPKPADTAETADTAAAMAYAPSWDGVQALFADRCDACHPATAGLDLRAAVADDLVNGTGLYVVPGDPGASRLWDALAGSTLSNMMPPSGRLDAVKVDHVHAWIAAGAPME